MKKILLLTSTLFVSVFVNAQSSLEVIDINNGQAVISNNAVIDYTTAALGNPPDDHITTDINARNTSASTKVYGLKRFDDVLNPGASAYFCVGGANCYPASVTVSPITITLTPNQDFNAHNKVLLLDLEEGSTVGYSAIRYQIYNVNDPNDVFTFTLKYNNTNAVGIKENYLFSSVSGVYPNPASTKASISINAAADAGTTSITVTNSLGSVVSTKNIAINAGKNTIAIDTESLSSGIYFATITSGNNRIVKKFTVNK